MAEVKESKYEKQYRVTNTIQTLQGLIALEVLDLSVKNAVVDKLTEFVKALEV